ncbi:hypothetical protein COCNU_05G008260 [Cocos nucifera]|uniref:Uncharacterized protein n=1 Tax=Cocos nucifera TaxID=13894 RepID=A0A8K0N1K7_COCNU|nr:hypothetical protein COCNU_05G008260 [Cocos nucifera]
MPGPVVPWTVVEHSGEGAAAADGAEARGDVVGAEEEQVGGGDGEAPRRKGRAGRGGQVVAGSDGPPFRVPMVPGSGTSRRGGEGEAAAALDGPHSTVRRLEAGDYATGQAAAERRGDGRLRRRWAPRRRGSGRSATAMEIEEDKRCSVLVCWKKMEGHRPGNQATIDATVPIRQ